MAGIDYKINSCYLDDFVSCKEIVKDTTIHLK